VARSEQGMARLVRLLNGEPRAKRPSRPWLGRNAQEYRSGDGAGRWKSRGRGPSRPCVRPFCFKSATHQEAGSSTRLAHPRGKGRAGPLTHWRRPGPGPLVPASARRVGAAGGRPGYPPARPGQGLPPDWPLRVCAGSRGQWAGGRRRAAAAWWPQGGTALARSGRRSPGDRRRPSDSSRGRTRSCAATRRAARAPVPGDGPPRVTRASAVAAVLCRPRVATGAARRSHESRRPRHSPLPPSLRPPQPPREPRQISMSRGMGPGGRERRRIPSAPGFLPRRACDPSLPLGPSPSRPRPAAQLSPVLLPPAAAARPIATATRANYPPPTPSPTSRAHPFRGRRLWESWEPWESWERA
jgi:hypothetical protein